MLICPVCGAALIHHDKAFVCANTHSFDIAREGYVNLLRGSGSSKARGDTREMLLARRRFLACGYYAPLVAGIGEAVAQHVPSAGEGADVVLDVGCGEGYYLGQLRDLLGRQTPAHTYSYLGIDISKEAARLAARAYADLHFVVADVTQQLPVADGAVAALLNVFAPRNVAEFARVLAPGGLLLVVIPAPDHLTELRARLPLLGIEAHKEQHVIAQFAESGFAHVETRRICEVATLDADALADLVTMTPNYWHQSEAWRERVEVIAPLRTTFDFALLAFRWR